MSKQKILTSMLVAAGLVSPLAAHATNGYMPIGFGMQNESMGGVGYALPQDSLAAATNPAGMAMVGDRTDIGLTWFRPNRTNTNNALSGVPNPGTYSGNGRSNFFIPDVGYNKMMAADTAVGVSIYGAGGMNTQYNQGQFYGGPGTGGRAGVNLGQLYIAPTWAMKINPSNSIGVSLDLVYQTFSATGLALFQSPGFSQDPNSITNKGGDTSTGAGIKLGWTGEITPTVTLGAAYQPRISMSKFSKYKGLFADQGRFDIPAKFGGGVAVKANDQTTVAFDLERIMYGGVQSVGNSPYKFFGGAQFGSSNGPGFGWSNMTVFKLGAKYALDSKTTLRVGFNHNSQQIKGQDAWINVLAPGVVQNHLTLGATWALADKSEVTVAYVHAFQQTVTGVTPFGFPGNTVALKMSEDSIGVMYGW